MANKASNNQHEHYLHGTESEKPHRLKGYVTDGMTDVLIGHLRKHTDTDEEYDPFFGVLSVQPPHGPTVSYTD